MDTEDSSDGEEEHRARRASKMPSEEEILHLLECPVCLELPMAPIRTCMQGHIICADCCPKLTRCPLCQKPIGYGRNYFAEDFINRTRLFCTYREDGCRLSVMGAQLKNHIKKCKFRPFQCRYCAHPVRYPDIEKHLQDDHHITPWDINEAGVKMLHVDKQGRVGDTIRYRTRKRQQITTSNSNFVVLKHTCFGFSDSENECDLK